MHNLNTQAEPMGTLPKIAVWLLSRLSNPAYREELIGDMEEEYQDRSQAGLQTSAWLLRQTASAIWDGQKAMVKTTQFLKALSIVFCLMLLPTIIVFVGWLSNVSEPSEYLWQLLLDGEVHTIVFNSEFWQLAWHESGIKHLEFNMFINIPAILWAMVFAASTYLYLKNSQPSAWVFSLFALAFLSVPYLFGYGIISALTPEPKKVGPILAFMMLAPFWTLPVYVGFLFKQYSKKYDV